MRAVCYGVVVVALGSDSLVSSVLLCQIGLLTSGGKSLPPETDLEIIFSLIGMQLGLFVVAYLIGNVANIIANLDIFATQFLGVGNCGTLNEH